MIDKKKKFEVVEASISDFHRALKEGRTTVTKVVNAYLDRVKAYNGVSRMLVSENGEEVAEVPGVMRGGVALRFPQLLL